MTTPARDLPAGRALDAIVAERVVGLRVVALDWPCGHDPSCGDYEAAMYREGVGLYENGSWFTDRGPVYVPQGGVWPPVEHFPGTAPASAIVEPVPFYSTDLVAAMALIAGWSGDVDLRRQNGVWRAELFRPSVQWDALADTLPLAICRVLLRRVGAEQEAPG